MLGWSENRSAFLYVFLAPYRLIGFAMSIFLGLGGVSSSSWLARIITTCACISLTPPLYSLSVNVFGRSYLIAGALVLALLLAFADLFRYLNRPNIKLDEI